MAEAQSQFPWSEPLFPIFDKLVKKGKQIFHDSGGTAEINFDTPSEIILPLTARELVKENKSPPDDFSLCVLLGNDLLQCIRHEEEGHEPTWKIYIHDTKYFDANAFARAVDISKHDYRGFDTDALTKVELVKKLFEMLNSEKKLSSVDFVNILLGIQQINSSGIFNNIRDISKRTMLSKYEESPNKRKLASLFEFITLFSNEIVYNIRYKSSDKFIIQTKISTFFNIFSSDGIKSLPFEIDLTYVLDLTKSGGYPGFEINKTSIVACFDILEFCYQIIIDNLSNVHVITGNNEIIYDEFFKAMITDTNGDFSIENIKAILYRKRVSFREAAAAQAASRAATATARAATAAAQAAATAATKQSDNVQARLARSYGGKRFKRKEDWHFQYSKQHSLRDKNKSRKNKFRKNKFRKNKSRKNKSRK